MMDTTANPYSSRLVVARRPDAALASRWLSSLDSFSPGERRRILSFRRWEDAAASLLARALMIELAADALQCVPFEIRLERTPTGRPFVAAPSLTRLDVNAAHAESWVAAASSGGRIGVDLEQERPIPDGLIERCLSSDERSALEGQPAERARSRFFQLWTLKESYLKATGIGLACDLRTIDFAILGDDPPLLRIRSTGRDHHRWRFRCWNPAPGMWLSVCSDQALPDRMELREVVSR
jgi:4'-phosphopantetheinyl transferase